MDLNIKNLWVVNIGGVEVWITETIFNTWVIMMLLIALAVVVRIKLRGFREIPAGFQNIVEAPWRYLKSLSVILWGQTLLCSTLVLHGVCVHIDLLPAQHDRYKGSDSGLGDHHGAFACYLRNNDCIGAAASERRICESLFAPNPVFFR